MSDKNALTSSGVDRHLVVVYQIANEKSSRAAVSVITRLFFTIQTIFFEKIINDFFFCVV